MNAFLNDVQTMVNETDTDNNICLISQTVLQNDYVTLECGHKYNYGSIFQELKNQKIHKNNYETQHLKTCQLKCPYCRNVQNKILPFYKDKIDEFPKIYGVNSPSRHCMYTSKCSHIFKTGKRKGIACNNHCNGNLCNTHKNNIYKHRCHAIIGTGIRKNQRCLNSVKIGNFCLIHQIKKKE